MELVDMLGLEPSAARRGGSTPFSRTKPGIFSGFFLFPGPKGLIVFINVPRGSVLVIQTKRNPSRMSRSQSSWVASRQIDFIGRIDNR